MTGEQFERMFCDWLKQQGFWALNIPKNRTGAQPFDVLAMRNHSVIAADCKVISDGPATFPFDRIEDNQRLAFEAISRKAAVLCCVAVYHVPTATIYLVPYVDILGDEALDKKSLWLSGTYRAETIIRWWDHTGATGGL